MQQFLTRCFLVLILKAVFAFNYNYFICYYYYFQFLKQAGAEFDIAYTSVLKRAIKTLYLIQEELDCHWLPVIKSWRLNERHYGALQGLNKAETAEKYGDAQVKVSHIDLNEVLNILVKNHAM